MPVKIHVNSKGEARGPTDHPLRDATRMHCCCCWLKNSCSALVSKLIMCLERVWYSLLKSNCDLIALIFTFLFNGTLHLNYMIFAYFMKAASDQSHQTWQLKQGAFLGMVCWHFMALENNILVNSKVLMLPLLCKFHGQNGVVMMVHIIPYIRFVLACVTYILSISILGRLPQV